MHSLRGEQRKTKNSPCFHRSRSRAPSSKCAYTSFIQTSCTTILSLLFFLNKCVRVIIKLIIAGDFNSESQQWDRFVNSESIKANRSQGLLMPLEITLNFKLNQVLSVAHIRFLGLILLIYFLLMHSLIASLYVVRQLVAPQVGVAEYQIWAS